MQHDTRDITLQPLTPARRDELLAFFEQRAFADHPAWASCYCHFPHADHAVVVWKQRSAADNRAASTERIDAGTMQGWLAYDQRGVAGWCNAGPRQRVEAMLGEHDPQAQTIGAIVCFVVAPECRRQGVAGALLRRAVDGLRAQGFAWAEAYPRSDPADDGANHFGPLAMFVAAGFTVHGPEGDDGVVVRLRL